MDWASKELQKRKAKFQDQVSKAQSAAAAPAGNIIMWDVAEIKYGFMNVTEVCGITKYVLIAVITITIIIINVFISFTISMFLYCHD